MGPWAWDSCFHLDIDALTPPDPRQKVLEELIAEGFLDPEELKKPGLVGWKPLDVPTVTSLLSVSDIRRGLARFAVSEDIGQFAEKLIAELVLLPVNRSVVDRASQLPGRHLRSIDAIHLASAQRLHSALIALITYDPRMARAAAEAGVPTETPR